MMNHGKLLDLDTPQNIRDKMKGAVYEIICSPVREAYQTAKEWDNIQEVQLYGDRLNIILTPEGKKIEAVIDELKAKKIKVQSWRQIPPRLENIFVSMMGHEDELLANEDQEKK